MVTLDQVRTQIADRAQLWPTSTEPPELLGTADGEAQIFVLRYENYIPGTLTVYKATPPAAGSGNAPSFVAVNPTSPISVGTTSETAVLGAGSYVITPASMANIALGVALLVDESPNQEVVIVTAVTGTTFTATFTMAHAIGFAIAGAPVYIVGSPNVNADDTQANNATITFSLPPTSGTLIGARYQVTAFSDADLLGYLSRAQTVQYDDISILKRTQYDIIDVILMDYNRLYLLAQGDFRTDAAAYAESLKQSKAELRVDLFGGPVAGAAIPAVIIGQQVTRRYQPLR